MFSLEGRLQSDLLTAHLYTPDADRWRELLDKLVAGQLNGVAAFPLVVGDPFFLSSPGAVAGNRMGWFWLRELWRAKRFGRPGSTNQIV